VSNLLQLAENARRAVEQDRASSGMRDGFGRRIEYLRISVTDKCNLRCVYCMPEAGLPWLARNELLTYEEITSIVRQLAALGGNAKLRLQDGQPLVTDNGQHILDVTGLQIGEPLAFETEVNQWPGVVTVGVFALQKAAVCLLGTSGGVQTLQF